MNIFEDLAAPFEEKDIEWRAGATNTNKDKAMALAYVTSRAVMNRLDTVLTPANWQDDYKSGPDGGVICGIGLLVDRGDRSEWVTKWDGADSPRFEAVKGGLSDAFKRAAVKWGIGRYLYDLPNVWVKCHKQGDTVVLDETPKLPAWALPKPKKAKPEMVTEAAIETGATVREETTVGRPTMTLETAEAIVITKTNGERVRLGDMSHDQLLTVQAYYEGLLDKGPLTDPQIKTYSAVKTILEA